jgi:hypothetical protein
VTERSPDGAGKNGGWWTQRIPLWLAITLGGTGAYTGIGNGVWLDNNEPRFQQNVARLDAQADTLARIEKHLASIDIRIDRLRDEKVDVATSLRNVEGVKQEIRDLREQVDLLRDRIGYRRSTPDEP